MNAPETLKPINDAHKVLMEANDALCVEDVARAILGGDKPTKADIKAAAKRLKELADIGMIEMEQRAGGVPLYRLISAPASNINEMREVGDIDVVESSREDSDRAVIPPPQYDPASVAFPASVVTRDPHTGMPRNLLDIESDPAGLLIVKDGEPMKAYQAEERILTPEAEAEREDFEARYGMLGNCSCHISPPCGSCTHPGNPRNQEEDETAWVAAGDSEGGETDAPAVKFLAPEDYEMPPADPVLLASANKMLCERMEAIAEQLRAGTIPELENVTGAEDLAPHVKTLCDALADAESVATARGHMIDGLRLEVADLRERLDAQIKQWQADTGRLAADLRAATEARSQAINEADRLRAELAAERRAREALQEKGSATDVTAAAVGYLVRVPKRAPIIRRKPEAARLAALGAVRAGAARADVLAIVPVGTARRGAEWGDA